MKIRQTNATLKAVIYAPYNSDQQRREYIDYQINSCRRYCETRGLEVIKVYADAAIFGVSDKRPKFTRLREDMEMRTFQVVVVDTLDRVIRNPSDTALFHARLSFHGLKLHVTEVRRGLIKEADKVGGIRHDPQTSLR